MREFLEARLTPDEEAVLGHQIEAMNGNPDDSPPLSFPRTSPIEGGLRELRCHAGSSLYRILYRRSKNLFLLLHVIHKDTRAIPKRDIALAQRRWREFKQRMNALDRHGPRPAGKDAP